ncbi:MAG: GxxExxY protein [Chloroflexi bacterium]|nr:MAG: GxxExxY protein [Chloroflexota bacterium]
MKEPDAYTNQLSHTVIGAAIEVHRALGPGFLESVYEEALCQELTLRNIPYEQQYSISVEYKGKTIGEHRLDILADRCLIVELKAVNALEDIHYAQVMSYLKATHLQLGLLINFNVPILKTGIKRIILSE